MMEYFWIFPLVIVLVVMYIYEKRLAEGEKRYTELHDRYMAKNLGEFTAVTRADEEEQPEPRTDEVLYEIEQSNYK